MDINFLLNNIDNPSVLITGICGYYKTVFSNDWYKEYFVQGHKVMNAFHRPDKQVDKPIPNEYDSQNNQKTTSVTVARARIALALQKLIVKRAVAFMTAPVSFSANPANEKEQRIFDAVSGAWRDNKFDYRNSQIARAVLSETECAEIWYTVTDQQGEPQLRSNIYSPACGHELYPVFDYNRNLISFGLKFKVKVESKEQWNFHLYWYNQTAKQYELRKYSDENGWELLPSTEENENPKKLNYGKLPVIFYSVPEVAWADVQTMIDRLETVMSNFADTNDYNGSPILFAKGTITGFASKGEPGKIIEGAGNDSDLRYVTWEQAPQSIQAEIKYLKEFIYTVTQTPDISFEAMQGLGDISAIAFDRIMIDAHLKAKEAQQGWYGEGIQRRLNFLVSACRAIDTTIPDATTIDITPVFSLFRIDDDAAKVELAMKANGGLPVIDQKASIALAGQTDDVDATYDAIKQQDEAKDANTDNPTNNPENQS